MVCNPQSVAAAERVSRAVENLKSVMVRTETTNRAWTLSKSNDRMVPVILREYKDGFTPGLLLYSFI